MKTLAAFGIVAALVVGGSARAADDDNAKKIVGKWELTKSEDPGAPIGAAVEFTKDGKVTIVAKADGKELKLDGTYKIEKDKLITKISFGGKTDEDTDEIVKLTDDTLELRDKDKKITVLKRKK